MCLSRNPWRYLTLLLPLVNAAALAGETTRVAASHPLKFGFDYSPQLSADGRYVAFSFVFDDAADTNGWEDVFIHDRVTRRTTRVSVSSQGVQAEGGPSRSPSVSADGRYVAFVSDATNLVIDDSNGATDVFVHDRVIRRTTRVSVSSEGAQANGSCFSPSISADGRYVAFVSEATNLVVRDTNRADDVFIHDTVTGQTTRVSVNSRGQQAGQPSRTPSLSADGRYVAFWSAATNLVPGDTSWPDIFVHDRVTLRTTRVSVASTGEAANSFSEAPSVSADGRYVAFYSSASNLVADDTNAKTDVFVHDRLKRQTTRVSVRSNGEQANDISRNFFSDPRGPGITADGRYVAFKSWATNLVPGDTNAEPDIFVHDRLKRRTTRISVASNDRQADSWSDSPQLSADGRYVAFESLASNLTKGDTNAVPDIFIRDRDLMRPVHRADLTVAVTMAPGTLQTGSQGTFRFSITNNGPEETSPVRAVHAVSQASVVSFDYSEAGCRPYATIILCNFGRLAPNTSRTFNVRVMATGRPSFRQLLTVASPYLDAKPSDNTINVTTRVTAAR